MYIWLGASKNNEVTKFEDDSDDDDDWSEKPAKKDDKIKKPPEKEESRKKESTFLGGVFSKNKEAAPPKLPTRKIVGERFEKTETFWCTVLLQWRLFNSALVVPRTRMSITRTCSWGETSTSWRGPSTMWTPSQTTSSSTWVIHVVIFNIIVINIPGSARGICPYAPSLWSAAWAAGPGGGQCLQRQHPAQQTGGPEEEIRPEVQLGREGSRQDQWGLEPTKGMMTECCWDEFNCVTFLGDHWRIRPGKVQSCQQDRCRWQRKQNRSQVSQHKHYSSFHIAVKHISLQI